MKMKKREVKSKDKKDDLNTKTRAVKCSGEVLI